jgi:alcohol dehydrogenase (NADP+)
MTRPTHGYAATAPERPLGPHAFERRDPGPTDVEIEILFCGVCHSDLHMARGEWGGTQYPFIPGHEIVGRVAAVGDRVSGHAVGDRVAVGCMVDSCRECDSCRGGLEQYCADTVYTYGSVEKQTGWPTAGGYSNLIVVDEAFVLRLSDQVDLAATAPILCAGVTTYSPLRHWGVGPGSRVGVIGLGGLGHMGVRLAVAMGAEVLVFTTSPGKADDARSLGASEVVVTTDPAQMGEHGELDLILNTVSVPLDLGPFLQQLRLDGAMVLLGVPPTPHLPPSAVHLIEGRRSLAGSGIGGIGETQELLDFCAERGIVSEVEVIAIAEVNDAWERMVRGDVRYRFVIDMSSLEPR